MSNKWEHEAPLNIKTGDYVLATKYGDGDPGDQYAVGFYNGCYTNGPSTRHLVVDEKGQNFRHNGFRRVARISARRGTWICQNLKLIDSMMDQYSVWHWYRAPWKELEATTQQSGGGG